jgi:hypothetical protein
MMEADLFSRTWIYHQVFNVSEDDAENIQTQVIKDKKEAWRRQQIADEGNDPMTSNQSADDGEMSDIGGDGDLGDLGGGGGDLGSDLGDLGDELGGDAPDLPPLEEDVDVDVTLDEETREDRERGRRESQEGNKKKYTSPHTKNYGEDPLGYGQNKEKSKTERTLRHNYRGSPLSMQETLKDIKKTLLMRYSTKNKGVISEKKSILDESNLINDDKDL